MNPMLRGRRDAARKGESGQALTELACALPLILCVMLILLFIAGTGLSGIRALKFARENAERSAVDRTSASDGEMIRGWHYDGIVPFSARDRVRSGSTALPDQAAAEGLEDGAWSINGAANPWFEYTGPGGLKHLHGISDSVFAVRPSMFSAAARLVRGRADAENNFFYRRWQERQIRSFELTFGRLFSASITEMDIARQRTNTVFMPVPR